MGFSITFLLLKKSEQQQFWEEYKYLSELGSSEFITHVAALWR